MRKSFPRQIVEHRKLVGEQQQNVRGAKRVRLRLGREPALDVAHGLVAKAADQTAAEARQAGRRRRPVAGAHGLYEVQRVFLVGLIDKGAVAIFAAGVSDDLEACVRTQTDERVTPPALPPLH